MLTRRVSYLMVLVLAIVVVGCGQTASAGGAPGDAAPVGAAAVQSGVEAAAHTISVNGVGTASARPDVAVIQLGVETIDTDASLAVKENTASMADVMDVLKGMGIQESDIQTLNYNMWAEQVYDRDGQPSGETRYHLVHQVSVRLHDLSKTGELLQQALEAGANNVSGISFSVADPEALQQEARDEAIANAKAKAQQLASLLGVQLGSLRQASEFGAAPKPLLEGIGGGGQVPVSGGQLNVSVEVQVVFDLAE